MSVTHPNALEVAAAEATLEETPTEVVMDDIVASTASINEASDQVGEISRNVVDLGNAAASVENYVNRFLEQVSAESWNPRLAHQYQIGMESILKSCGVAVPASIFCASFEAAGVTETNEENRDKTKDKSEGVIKRLWTAFLEMISRLWDSVQNFTAFLGASTGKMRKMAENIKAQVTKAKNDGLSAKEDHYLEGKWSSYLVEDIGGGATKTTAFPPTALKNMAAKCIGFTKEWYDNYLNGVKEMAGGNFTSMASMDSGDLMAEVERLVNPKLKSYNGAWPGGYVVSVQRDKDHLDKFELSVKASPADAGKVKVMSLEDINLVADEIIEMAKLIDGEIARFQSGKKEIEAVKKKMESAIKGGEKPINAKVVSLAGSLMDGMMEGPRKVLPLLGRACVKAAQHAEASLKQYKAVKK